MLNSLHAQLTSLHHLLTAFKKYSLVIKQFCIFACGALLTRGITLVFAPITMQILTPADYGVLALANNLVSILTALLGLGLRQMLPLHYFQATPTERTILITDIICIYLMVSVPTLLFISLHLTAINQYLFLDQAPKLLLILSLMISFIYFFFELYYQLLQYRQEAWQLTCLQTGVTLITITANLFFLCYLRMGICAVFLGQLLAMLCACVYGTRLFVGTIRDVFNAKRTLSVLRTYILMGAPFIPSMLLGLMLASIDRWVLAYLTGLHTVGIYCVASTLGQLTNMIAFYAITGSYMPYKLAQFAQHSDQLVLCERENKRAMWCSMAFSFVLLTIGFATCKSILYWFLPPAYHEAIGYMYLLLIGSIFLLGTYFLNCLLQFKKKSLFLGLVLCVPTSLNLLLNLLLVPYFGLYGCVLATLIAYISYFLITLWYNMHVLKKTV